MDRFKNYKQIERMCGMRTALGIEAAVRLRNNDGWSYSHAARHVIACIAHLQSLGEDVSALPWSCVEWPIKRWYGSAWPSTSKLEDKRAALRAGLDESQKALSGAGALSCKKCGSDRVTLPQAQMRSADEPMDVFCVCTQCKFGWKVNN